VTAPSFRLFVLRLNYPPFIGVQFALVREKAKSSLNQFPIFDVPLAKQILKVDGVQ